MKSNSNNGFPLVDVRSFGARAGSASSFMLDDRQYIIAAGQHFIDFIGLPVVELPFRTLLCPDSQQKLALLTTSAQPGVPVQDELCFVGPSGSKKGLTTLVAIHESGALYFQGLLWQMPHEHRPPDLEKLQQLAQENARRLMALAESTSDCFFMINAQGYLEYFNQNAQKAMGMDSGVQLGQSLEEIMQRTHALDLLPRYRQVMHTRQAQHFEVFYQPRNAWFEVHAFPANGGILVYFRNINERKKAELHLAMSEQKFKAMVQNGSDIIAVLDKQMNLQYISPSVTRIAGYDPEELLGKNAAQFVHAADLHKVAKDFGNVLQSSNNGTETAHRFRHSAGHYIWLESKAMNLIQDNCIAGIIINARDISHHKELEAKLAQAVQSRQKEVTNAVIRAQERERAQLGQELHDNVNQVLTTIKLYNEMVLEGMGNGKELLPRSIFHLQSCINEIRSISKRLSAPTLGKISLYDSIRELVESVNLTNRLKIGYQIAGLDGCTVSQDLHLCIYRIIQEQLNNTLKYAQASNLHINIINSPRRLTVALQDDGQGFDVNQKRSGIGITNMKTRAENLNGSFFICSRPGGGCRVRVVFPPVS